MQDDSHACMSSLIAENKIDQNEEAKIVSGCEKDFLLTKRLLFLLLVTITVTGHYDVTETLDQWFLDVFWLWVKALLFGISLPLH